MKIIYRQIISSILFIAIVIFCVVQLSYLYRGEFSHTRSHVAGFYAEKDDSVDVIFTGASQMFCSYMPMEAWHDYGMTSYNFSINMLMGEAYKYYVREALKTQSPKLYVIDLGAFASGVKAENAVGADGSFFTLQANVDALNYSINRLNLINAVVPSDVNKMDYYFDILYYHASDGLNFKYLGNKRHSFEKGYSSLPLFSDEVWVNSDVKDLSQKETPLDDNFNAVFFDLINEMKQYDMQVLFISQPNVCTNDVDVAKQEKINYMKRIVKENGFDYLDLSDYKDDIGLNPTFDLALGVGDHFNCFGAEKITRFLSKYIVENYDIPDHRGEKKYGVWDEDYKEWLAILDIEKEYNSGFMVETLTEEDNIEKMPGILENANEYFRIEGNKAVNKYTGDEIEF